MTKVRLHVILSMLAYSGTMLSRLRTGDYRGMRDMSVDWPTAASSVPWAWPSAA